MTGVPGTSDFPTAIDSHVTLLQVKDLASTTVGSGGVNSSVTTIIATSTSTFPATGAITIAGEHIKYTSTDATHFLGCTRGAFTSLGGSAAASHTAGTVIKLLNISAQHEVQNDAIIATQTKLGSGADTPANGAFFKGTGPGTSAWGSLTSGDVTSALGYTPAEGIILQEGDATETATATTLDFDDAYFDVSVSPAKEGNVTFASGAVQDAGTLVIASGVVTLPAIYPIVSVILATVDTESAAATDDLDTINVTGSVATGTILVLKSLSASRDVTVKNGTGNLTLTDGDFVMGTTGYRLVLQRIGSSWVELARQPLSDTYAVKSVIAPSLVPTGSVTAFAGASAPTGWLLCDGSAVSRATYAALFALISTAYGVGDGSTTFNVPDLRDRFPIGKGADAANDALGETGGARDVTLTSAQSGLKAHNHAAGTLGADTAGSHTHTINQVYAGVAGSDTVRAAATTTAQTAITNSGGAHPHTISGSVASNVAADAASAHTNMPPFLTINFIIKV